MLQEPPPDKPEVRKEEWTPVRARTDSELPERSKVRLGIESSRDGFVYVIDREAYADKTTGPPQLIFPTLHTHLAGATASYAAFVWNYRHRAPMLYIGI